MMYVAEAHRPKLKKAMQRGRNGSGSFQACASSSGIQDERVLGPLMQANGASASSSTRACGRRNVCAADGLPFGTVWRAAVSHADSPPWGSCNSQPAVVASGRALPT